MDKKAALQRVGGDRVHRGGGRGVRIRDDGEPDGDVLRVLLSGLPVAFVLRMKVELPAVPTHGWPLSPVLLMDHRREPSVRE